MVAQSKLTQIFSYQSWIHAVSGAAGGCIAMGTFYPLDTVRSRLQIGEHNDDDNEPNTLDMMKRIILTEGFRSLYCGIGPVLQSLCISNFVYFYAFHSLKTLLWRSRQSVAKDLLFGSMAGILNVLLTTPFWVVNTRLRMRNVRNAPKVHDASTTKYNTLLAGIIHIARNEGIGRLWSGTVASLMLVTNPAVQFMVYEMLKRYLTQIKGGSSSNITSINHFVMGAIAKSIATVLTYPLQLLQMKQRHHGHADDVFEGETANGIARNRGLVDLLSSIVREHGFAGLFRGLEAKILQTVLTAALMFTAYEKIVKLVRLLLLRNAPAMLK